MTSGTGIHTPAWHPDEQTPVVDGKYYDKRTGELVVATDDSGYLGPPAVDIIITSVAHLCLSRWARAFPVEQLLWQVMKVIKTNNLALDSLSVTPYAIRIILSSPATSAEMGHWANRMANGIWDPEVCHSHGTQSRKWCR